uniref:MAGE domain-containing protein n=1 Tax=Macrostomum lignano TaxID=282301 RepID=A0A1I8FCR3_9PLAT
LAGAAGPHSEPRWPQKAAEIRNGHQQQLQACTLLELAASILYRRMDIRVKQNKTGEWHWAPRQPILTAVSALGQPQMKMAEKNLIKQLLQHYDKKSRPVIDADPPYGTPKIERRKEKARKLVTVEFGLRLVQILDLDEMEQVLTTSMISLYKVRKSDDKAKDSCDQYFIFILSRSEALLSSIASLNNR